MSNRFRLIVDIDIKPFSDPNSINLDAVKQIPVAILSSEGFDATTCDPATVSLAGGSVRLVGKGNKFQSGIEDANGDGLLDLVVHIDTADSMIQPGDSVAELTATCGDLVITGSDAIRIVSQ